MIDSVHFENIKLFREVDIPLERLTVFVGPNSSGKTTILEAIYRVLEMGRLATADAWPTDLFRGRFFPTQVRREIDRPAIFSCRGSKDGQPHRVSWTIAEALPRDGARRWILIPQLNDQGGYSWTMEQGIGQLENALIMRGSSQGFFIKGLDVFGPGKFIRLDVNDITEPGEPGRMDLTETGKGITSILQELALSQPDQFQLLQSAVKTVIPSVDRIRMAPTKVLRTENLIRKEGEKIITERIGREFQAYRLIVDMNGAPELFGESVSEGTLLVIGILAALMAPNRPEVLLIDDIDRGLHPKAMSELISAIRRALEQNPNLQVIATSHSPYLLDHLNFKEVRITTLDDDGSARVGMLSDHPDFDEWKNYMTPGEFWSSVGEKWLVAKGKPSHA